MEAYKNQIAKTVEGFNSKYAANRQAIQQAHETLTAEKRDAAVTDAKGRINADYKAAVQAVNEAFDAYSSRYEGLKLPKIDEHAAKLLEGDLTQEEFSALAAQHSGNASMNILFRNYAKAHPNLHYTPGVFGEAEKAAAENIRKNAEKYLSGVIHGIPTKAFNIEDAMKDFTPKIMF